MEKKRAVILFADILGSTEFAATQTGERYNEMLRAFHRMSHDVIEAYKQAEGLGGDRVYAGGVGDECHVFLVGGAPNEDEGHAMDLAVNLKQGWKNSDFGKALTELGQNPYGAEVDLRIGVGCGDVVFDQDVWTGSITPEGMIISEAKRIETLAGDLAKETYILVKLDIREAAEKAKLPITFGDRIYADAKGFRGGTYQVAVYPVLTHGDFKSVQQEATPQPRTAPEYALLAQALQRSGDLDGAILNYRRAVEVDPRFHQAWNNMGVVHGHKGEHDQAISCYERAVQTKPDYHEVWNNMGVAYGHRGEYDQAISCFQRALEIKPDKHEAWNNMGVAYGHKGEYDQALSCFQRCLEIAPNYHDAWNGMGNAYDNKGEYDRAITYYQRTVEIKPDNAETWNNMGVAYGQKGEYDQAIACYQRALEITPDYHVAWYNLGCEYSLTGNPRMALDYLTKALALNPSYREDAKADLDFDPIREDPGFRQLVYCAES